MNRNKELPNRAVNFSFSFPFFLSGVVVVNSLYHNLLLLDQA